jgi:hypothetical protein
MLMTVIPTRSSLLPKNSSSSCLIIAMSDKSHRRRIHHDSVIPRHGSESSNSGAELGADVQLNRLRTFIGKMKLLNEIIDDNSTAGTVKPRPTYSPEDWGASAWEQDWDPAEDLNEEDIEQIAYEAEEEFRRNPGQETPRDKWITPLLDFGSVSGAIDPDQGQSCAGPTFNCDMICCTPFPPNLII